MESRQMALEMAKILDGKKAKGIEVLNISNISLIADYFVICTGSSTPHIKSLAEEIDEKFSEKGIEPLHREGLSTAAWVLLDYGSVVVHIFNSESRSFYNLERLWSDAEKENLKDIIVAD